MFNTMPGSTSALLKELHPEVDTISICEHCEQPCEEPHGTTINECCVCANSGAPRSYKWEPCELCAKRLNPLTCEYCSNATDALYPVDDVDLSVGYQDVLMVCGKCRDRR